jgi:predicted CoA-substrate-specific enzyme activase
MIQAGIDIGSRTIKLVMMQDGRILHSHVTENSFDTIGICRKMLDGRHYDSIVATGYGRHFFADHFTSEVISEIKAFSLGVHAIFPEVRTVLDIGGQDTKAIALDGKGRVLKFEMNDKCAAGTGRFLEIMAMALRYSLDDFGDAALSVERKENISSMCTVFAESEVIGMLAKGGDRAGIARGIHSSVIARSVRLLTKVGVNPAVAFVGGVAKNKAMLHLLAENLNTEILVPPDPQIVGAIGCAVHNSQTPIN